MKTIGVIAGLSWESSVIYYQVLNTTVKERLGGLHSARCIFHSVDFQPVEACMAKGDWDGVAEIVCGAAVSLERAGAEFFLLATNTIHKVADRLRASVGIPFLHIAEATADALSGFSARSTRWRTLSTATFLKRAASKSSLPTRPPASV